MNELSTEVPSTLPSMVDTHCHLDDHQFHGDLEVVLENSRSAQVNRWVLIGYDPRRWDSAIGMANEHRGMFHTLGVHPACAEQWSPDVAARLRELAVSSGAVGIGEIGLDFYRDNAPLEVQAAAFSEQLAIARELNRPVVIHMRDAESEMLQILESAASLPTLIFHSFDGSQPLMDFILGSQSYVGIGGLATRQKSEALRSLLSQVPHEQILLETDSPYLVPARQKDRRNQPAQVATVANMMAEHLSTTPANLAEISTANAERVFGLQHD